MTINLIEAIAIYKQEIKTKTIKIKGIDYVEVDKTLGIVRNILGERLVLLDEILHHDDKRVVIQTKGFIDDKLIAIGLAEEVRGSTMINKTSALENCQTSAWGRCLACMGFKHNSVASADEVNQAIAQQYKPVALQQNEPVDKLEKAKEFTADVCDKVYKSIDITQLKTVGRTYQAATDVLRDKYPDLYKQYMDIYSKKNAELLKKEGITEVRPLNY